MTPAEAAALRESFSAFAREHPGERLYAALARWVADAPARGALLLAAPSTQRKAVLWFAALHHRLLRRAKPPVGTSLPALPFVEANAVQGLPALASYVATVGGTRAPDDGLPAAVEAFLAEEHDALRETIATRATQTNEVGRCAVLAPALAAVAAAHGGRPLALFDFGCSAGLNLTVDHLGLRWHAHGAPDAGTVVAGAPDAPALTCRWLGPGRPPVPHYRIAARLGVDPSPVSLDDEDGLAWLRACLWPGEQARHTRFAQAVALARRLRPPVQQADDALAALEAWLPTLPEGCVPVLFNSWVLAYFGADALASHVARVRRLVSAHGLVWLSAEDDGRSRAVLGITPLPARPDAAGTPTWWVLTERADPAAPSAVRTRLLACSHPHGEWLQWLA